MTRHLFWLWLALSCWLVALPVFGQPAITRAVSDYADVMDPQSIAQIESALRQHQDKTGNQIAILLLQSLDGQPIEDLALRTAVKWGGGTKELDNGLLVVIAVQDRRSRIEVGYGLEATITDSTAKALLDSLRPELQAGDYAAAVAKLSNELMQRTGGARSITLSPDRQIKRTPAPVGVVDSGYDASPTDSGFDWFFLVFIAIVVMIIVISLFAGKSGQTFSSSGFSSSSSSSGSSWPSTSLFGSGSSTFGSSSSSSWGSSSSSSSSSSSGSSYSGGGGGFGGGGASSSW